MNPSASTRSLWPARLLVLAATALLLAEASIHWRALASNLVPMLSFALPAALAARIAVSSPAGHPIRLTLAFVLAALCGLPAPAGALTALLALACGGGGGLCGLFTRGGSAFAAAILPVALAELGPFGPNLSQQPAFLLFGLALLFTWLQGSSLLLGAIFAGGALGPRLRALKPVSRRLLFEAVNVALAFVLVGLASQRAWLALWAFSGLALLAAVVLRELDRADENLRRVNGALLRRVTELATLHSISREILSTLDPSRVFATTERECRKIFDVDFFFIALVEPATRELRVVYRCQREEPTETTRPMGDGLASWVVAEKRSIRVDDFQCDPRKLPFRPQVVDGNVRSALAVPLVVEEEVKGVLSVQSRRPEAYDDHQLSVLNTIGQQAAVALENARHYEMSTVDSLTGLFLREYFFRRLEEEYSRARRYTGSFALLMTDLDSFKEVNDRYGHIMGDRYLRAIGSTVRDRLRAADLACRYGGDEFCLLLPETDLAGAEHIAERVRTAVATLVVEAEGLVIRTTMSIGLAAYPNHEAKELRSLLCKADQALYQAKRAGRDRVCAFAA